MFRPDGRKFEGQFRQGQQHGEGTYVNAKGVVKSGTWKEGKRVKEDQEE